AGPGDDRSPTSSERFGDQPAIDPYRGYRTTGERGGAPLETPWEQIKPVDELQLIAQKHVDDQIFRAELRNAVFANEALRRCMTDPPQPKPPGVDRIESIVRLAIESHTD